MKLKQTTQSKTILSTMNGVVYIILTNTKKVAIATAKTFFRYGADKITWNEDPYGYVRGSINGESIFLHEFLAGKRPGLYVDHIDGDKSNNTDENLRVCTASENGYNRGVSKNNKLGIKGIKQEKDGKYVIHVWPDSDGRYIGRTYNLVAAKLVYNIASRAYQEDFARPHKVDRQEMTPEVFEEVYRVIELWKDRESKRNRDIPYQVDFRLYELGKEI
jgi:hypothetical protein